MCTRLKCVWQAKTVDGRVLLQELETGLTGPLADPGGDNQDAGAVEAGVAAGRDLQRMYKGDSVQQVIGLGLGAGFILVDEDNLGSDALHDQGVGGGRVDESGADDADFRRSPPRERITEHLKPQRKRPHPQTATSFAPGAGWRSPVRHTAWC